MRAIADLGVTNLTSTVIATRGERLALVRSRISGSDERPEAFDTEMSSSIIEIDADDRIAASRHVRPSTTSTPPSPNSMPGTSPAKRPPTRTRGRSSREPTPRSTGANSPRRHRTGSTSTTASVAAIRGGRPDRVPPCRVGPHAGHQHLHRGRASADRPRSGRHPCGARDLARGLRRRVAGDRPLTVDGDLINRCELFDEADLDAALARFDELSRPAPRLENAASQVYERFLDVLRGPRLGRHGGDVGRRHSHRRSPSGGERRGPTRSRCRDREYASHRRPRDRRT